MAEKLIYDFGSNSGDDIPYYLLKAEKVVAVEANPRLAEGIERRFADEIRSGRVVVESCVISVDSSSSTVPFFIHNANHVSSQFPEPPPSTRDRFERVLLPSRNVLEIIEQHGTPYYIKIDLEHYDHVVLRHLLLNGIRPPYISAESHSMDVFCLLVAIGEYSAYKLVDGASVSTKYANHTIDTLGGPLSYAFPPHSAGPFGNDIAGSWMTKDNLFSVLAYAKLGWKDLHASSLDQPDPQYAPSPFTYIGINY